MIKKIKSLIKLNNVWIGGKAVINPGVRIGNNVVVGPACCDYRYPYFV